MTATTTGPRPLAPAITRPDAVALTGTEQTVMVIPGARALDGTVYAVLAVPNEDPTEPFINTRRADDGTPLPEVVATRDEDGDWHVTWESIGAPEAVEAVMQAVREHDGDPRGVWGALNRSTPETVKPGIYVNALPSMIGVFLDTRFESNTLTHPGLQWALGNVWALVLAVHDGTAWTHHDAVADEDVYADPSVLTKAPGVIAAAHGFAHTALGLPAPEPRTDDSEVVAAALRGMSVEQVIEAVRAWADDPRVPRDDRQYVAATVMEARVEDPEVHLDDQGRVVNPRTGGVDVLVGTDEAVTTWRPDIDRDEDGQVTWTWGASSTEGGDAPETVFTMKSDDLPVSMPEDWENVD